MYAYVNYFYLIKNLLFKLCERRKETRCTFGTRDIDCSIVSVSISQVIACFGIRNSVDERSNTQN